MKISWAPITGKLSQVFWFSSKYFKYINYDQTFILSSHHLVKYFVDSLNMTEIILF